MSEQRTSDDDGLLGRLALVRPEERREVVLSALYFFFLLGSYFVLRPLRDQMGLVGGVKKLPDLWLWTLAGTLVASPFFAWVVSRWPRRKSLPIVYRVCESNLLAFLVLVLALKGEAGVWAARAFFVWVSVFNMFAVSVFWAFLADVFGSEQARRLFPVIGVGGTAAAVLSTALVGSLAETMEARWGLSPAWLILLSLVFLEIAVQFMLRVRPTTGAEPAAERPMGGGAFDGVLHLVRSPYLLGISAFVLTLAFSQSFLEFQKSNIVDAHFKGAGAQTSAFSWIEFGSQSLTLVLQLFVTGRVLRRLGFGFALVFLPCVCLVGFTLLGFAHLGAFSALGIMVAFVIVHRGLLNALVRPSREALFTVLPREQKYKAKNFIDTFVFRGGDALAAKAFGVLQYALSLSTLAFVALPAVALWGAAGLWLGAQERRRSRAAERGG